jgi:hypothetical protein
MEQNTDNKTELKDRIINFYSRSKLLLYSAACTLIIAIIIGLFVSTNIKKKNYLIAEKYIEAGIYLASNKREKSKNIYEEIILSKNKFYSILALNIILEKNLILDKKKILNYFQLVQDSNKSKEYKDLIIFKKALYMLKSGSLKEGNTLLKKLIDEKSKLKSLAEEIFTN